MFTWDQSEGKLYRDGVLVSTGYSGKGRGKNNPALENIAGIGPIPCGKYKIGAPYDSKNVGPYTLPLDAIDAVPGNDRDERTGRGAFRIHGDSIKAPGTASKGCIILPRKVRQYLWTSGVRTLQVVA